MNFQQFVNEVMKSLINFLLNVFQVMFCEMRMCKIIPERNSTLNKLIVIGILDATANGFLHISIVKERHSAAYYFDFVNFSQRRFIVCH